MYLHYVTPCGIDLYILPICRIANLKKCISCYHPKKYLHDRSIPERMCSAFKKHSLRPMQGWLDKERGCGGWCGDQCASCESASWFSCSITWSRKNSPTCTVIVSDRRWRGVWRGTACRISNNTCSGRGWSHDYRSSPPQCSPRCPLPCRPHGMVSSSHNWTWSAKAASRPYNVNLDNKCKWCSGWPDDTSAILKTLPISTADLLHNALLASSFFVLAQMSGNSPGWPWELFILITKSVNFRVKVSQSYFF